MLIISSFILFFSQSLDVSTVYDGHRLDLVDQPGWLLKSKNITKKDLSYDEIIKTIKQKQDLWELSKSFSYHPFDEDIYLQMRGNFSAVSVFINDSLLVKNGEYFPDGSIKNLARMQIIKRIPSDYLKKTNIISVVFSTEDIKGDFWIEDIALNSGSTIAEREPNYVFQPLFIAGFLLLAICVNIALFFAFQRQTVFIFLTLYFVCGFAFASGQVFYWWSNPTIHISLYTLDFLDMVSHLDKVFLVFVLLYQYQFDKKTKRITLIVSASFFLIAIVLLDLGSTSLLVFVCLFSFNAYAKKIDYSGMITIALFILLISSLMCESCIINQLVFIKNNSFLSLMFSYVDRLAIIYFAIVMLYMVTKRIYLQNIALSKSLLESSKLESQLIQKHIQPHFLINSLMSLQELIDEDKEKASSMIDALSKEFHALSKMSQKKLILLKDELEICKSHLEIMGHQQDAQFSLKTNGINGNELIPPAVILTLIENGLTHGYTGKQHGIFELSKYKADNSIEFRLFNDGQNLEQNQSSGNGTGLKYIKDRLEESYNGRWNLISRPTDGGWESIIQIRDKK